MSNGQDTGSFRAVFIAAAVVNVIYGLIFLLIPEVQLEISQDPGVPANPGWVRWAGGTLIGLGAGAWLLSSNPTGQRPFVTGFAVGTTLTCLALLYSLVAGEYQGVAWNIWLPIALTAVLALLYWWVLAKYKAVL